MTYVAFFEEQPGFLHSPGMKTLAGKARKAGLDVDLWRHDQVTTALTAAQLRLRRGEKVALCGHGGGVIGVGWVQQRLPVHLCIGIEPRVECSDFPLVDPRDSILMRSIADADDLGFQRIVDWDALYLFLDCDPRLRARVMKEIKALASK